MGARDLCSLPGLAFAHRADGAARIPTERNTMKLGVFTVLFGDRPLEAALDRIMAAVLDCVEIGTGNYPGVAHANPEELLADSGAFKIFQHTVASRGLEISALSCHGNPLHPQAEIARAQHETFVRTVKLAQRLEVT